MPTSVQEQAAQPVRANGTPNVTPPADPVKRYRATELFGQRKVLVIQHDDSDYVLRITRNGKLILTK